GSSGVLGLARAHSGAGPCAGWGVCFTVTTTYSSYRPVVYPQGVLTGVGCRRGVGGGGHVICPYCRNLDSRVIDSRTADDGAAIRRRRSCPSCGRRFTTQEAVILMVGKRSGA